MWVIKMDNGGRKEHMRMRTIMGESEMGQKVGERLQEVRVT